VKSCRFCGAELEQSFADLGMSPISNAFLRADQLTSMEPFYPLHAYVCSKCFLVQLDEFESAGNIFDAHYAYFSSFSESWLAHCEKHVRQMTERLELDEQSQVVEIASNDGYLLQYFVQAGIPALGIEPARNVAAAAEARGVRTLVSFFGGKVAAELAESGTTADLIIGNNVLAHVPDLNDFVAGLATLLKADGTISLEFPHLLCLMENNQFDTIYHEHFSYFSLQTVTRVFDAHGLRVYDVDRLSTHGGSLRVYGCHKASSALKGSGAVAALLAEEQRKGLLNLDTYKQFAENVRETKRKLLGFLIGAKRQGKVIVGYGAAAKGNTLLNYCGVQRDFIDYVVDRSPHKQNRFLPGTHIPVYSPEKILETRPDYVLILPWNLKDEIVQQMREIRAWGGRFVVPIPATEILE